MCLDYVTKTFRKPNPKVVEGWKVFGINAESELRFPYQNHQKARIGRWFKATRRIRNLKPVGFHVFEEKETAELWSSVHLASSAAKILRVRTRRILARGTHIGGKAFTCLELFIPKEKK